jgi:hypothetical protein
MGLAHINNTLIDREFFSGALYYQLVLYSTEKI